jgi:hypothetical protein
LKDYQTIFASSTHWPHRNPNGWAIAFPTKSCRAANEPKVGLDELAIQDRSCASYLDPCLICSRGHRKCLFKVDIIIIIVPKYILKTIILGSNRFLFMPLCKDRNELTLSFNFHEHISISVMSLLVKVKDAPLPWQNVKYLKNDKKRLMWIRSVLHARSLQYVEHWPSKFMLEVFYIKNKKSSACTRLVFHGEQMMCGNTLNKW